MKSKQIITNCDKHYEGTNLDQDTTRWGHFGKLVRADFTEMGTHLRWDLKDKKESTLQSSTGRLLVGGE